MEEKEIIIVQGNKLEYQKKHYDTIKKVVFYAKEIFNDNLCNITLGGSGGKGKIIDKWSDLDFYIILRRYDHKEIATSRVFPENPIAMLPFCRGNSRSDSQYVASVTAKPSPAPAATSYQ